MNTPNSISRRALLIEQDTRVPVYLFALTSDELEQIAEVSRVQRNNVGALIGYQRPEVRRHIQNIVDYLDSESPILPNAIILALSSSVRFTRSRGPNVDDGVVVAGTLEIPVPGDHDLRPAFIVDGQQRTAALRAAKNRRFPVPVAAFIADTVDIQREQFIRINSAKPLPAGLVTELLPQLSTPISPKTAARKLPSALVDLLASDDASPFRGLIKRPSITSTAKKQAVVTDTSLITALEESLQAPSSCLFPFRNLASGETDIDGIWAVILCYWNAVRDTFPEAWGLPPTNSRLMHGVGIRSMSRLMDRVMTNIDPLADGAESTVAKELAVIAPHCAWTGGTWTELGGVPWNQLQNTARDIKILTNFLIRTYVQGRTAG